MKKQPTVPGFTGKRRTPLQSIATFCRECFGGPAVDCAAMDCIFHPYRQGTIPEGASRQLVKVIKRYCAEQCLPQESPAGCTACAEYSGLAPCACWPYRMGRNPYIGDEQRSKLRQHAREQYQLAGGEARFRPRIDERPSA